jgi:hypothetical protein
VLPQSVRRCAHAHQFLSLLCHQTSGISQQS